MPCQTRPSLQTRINLCHNHHSRRGTQHTRSRTWVGTRTLYYSQTTNNSRQRCRLSSSSVVVVVVVVRSFVRSFVCSFVRSFVRLFVRFVRSFDLFQSCCSAHRTSPPRKYAKPVLRTTASSKTGTWPFTFTVHHPQFHNLSD